MRRHERFAPDDPREWLNRARSNLAIAKNRVQDAYLEDLCFDAQQAAEKAIKAMLILRGVDNFPYSHNLARLITLLEEHGEYIPDTVRSAAKLTRFSSHARYPGLEEPVYEDEYAEAIEMAEVVVCWAEGHLETRKR